MKPKLLANALCPFSQSMAHKILSRDKVETNKNVKKEREIDGERESEMGKGGGSGRERERQAQRQRGEGRAMYTSCAPFATMFSEKEGGSSDETNSGMETVKYI